MIIKKKRKKERKKKVGQAWRISGSVKCRQKLSKIGRETVCSLK